MAIKDFLVGDKKYKVDTLSVLDSIDFQIEFAKGIGGFLGKIGAVWATAQNGKEIGNEFLDTLFDGIKPEELKKLKKKVFAQVITPENKCLSDEIYLQEWFCREENREDVWLVLQSATVLLLGEYMPKFLKDFMKKGQERISAMETQSKSQKDTTHKPQSISR